MKKCVSAALAQNDETTEELIGVLTAISVVSKRLAKKLALLENLPLAERRNTQDASSKAAYSHAD